MGPLLFIQLFLIWQNFLIFSTWSISATFIFFFFYKIALFLNYFLLFTQLFTALVDAASLYSSLFAISVWANTSYSRFSADPIISLSLARNASLLPSFSFSYISFACYWIIFSFSRSSFTVRVDSASAISSLFAITSWARSFFFSFSWAERISLSIALGPSVLLSFSYYFIRLPCSWIIFCFSLSFFAALVDGASLSSSLFAISALDLSFSSNISEAFYRLISCW